MSDDWRDRLAGARMQVDQQFQDRLEQSQFSNQEWGLIMTAIEFDVEQPGDPDGAELVADTSKLDQIIPELDRIQQEMGGPGGSSNAPSPSSSATGGILARFKQYLGMSSAGSSRSDDRMAAAITLTEEYADELQVYLEERSRWDDIREAAAREQ